MSSTETREKKKPGGKKKPDAARTAQRRRRRPTVSLTARGAVAVVFAGTFAGALADLWVLPGVAFVAVCVLAALATRPDDLPVLVVAPPVLYLLGTLFANAVGMLGDRTFTQSMLVALPLDLVTRAPWLLAGTVAVAVIAVRRGLLTAWRELTLKADGFRLTRERYAEEDPVRWDERT
ncbi:DUF6542 domain-containing protein [Actinocorallia sp. A-T 12471]|uniref:DUF6542 domain-containing protein n=1 Tax=Actinocorallia sp. A-T 12471 TaxID=3089813 RepID=UPI0029D3C1CB|nr:DUF6542 domain-containing protein [Actinocorallia sp. A-T 12471]MDX6738601.1 DUF6542 domain-containing protein [Actinocorallia sp. A-T 12471]